MESCTCTWIFCILGFQRSSTLELLARKDCEIEKYITAKTARNIIFIMDPTYNVIVEADKMQVQRVLRVAKMYASSWNNNCVYQLLPHKDLTWSGHDGDILRVACICKHIGTAKSVQAGYMSDIRELERIVLDGKAKKTLHKEILKFMYPLVLLDSAGGDNQPKPQQLIWTIDWNHATTGKVVYMHYNNQFDLAQGVMQILPKWVHELVSEEAY